jgi:hypothetical protein
VPARASHAGEIVPAGFLPALWAAEEIRVAVAWVTFLLRERQPARRAQRIREFIVFADTCRARFQRRNQGVMLPR